ncbi:MAG: hypothetical protein ACOVOR_03025 [Rhabdochlamydiaceae bacterium]
MSSSKDVMLSSPYHSLSDSLSTPVINSNQQLQNTSKTAAVYRNSKIDQQDNVSGSNRSCSYAVVPSPLYSQDSSRAASPVPGNKKNKQNSVLSSKPITDDKIPDIDKFRQEHPVLMSQLETYVGKLNGLPINNAAAFIKEEDYNGNVLKINQDLSSSRALGVRKNGEGFDLFYIFKVEFLLDRRFCCFFREKRVGSEFLFLSFFYDNRFELQLNQSFLKNYIALPWDGLCSYSVSDLKEFWRPFLSGQERVANKIDVKIGNSIYPAKSLTIKAV